MSLIPFDAVLFDCDGVLVDSARITRVVLTQLLGERGRSLSVEETMRIFVGKAVKDEAARIEAHTGFAITDAWLQGFRARRNEARERDLVEIPGAPAAVRGACGHQRTHRGRLWRRPAQGRTALRKVDLIDCFERHIYSGHTSRTSSPTWRSFPPCSPPGHRLIAGRLDS
ncbi:MAG: HAD family phosphatase [Paraburkholderia sp.]|nr:HAD family phosphatase [Paraburkholderia sp.]